MPKGILRVSEKNKILIIKSVGLDLVLIIGAGVDSDLTALRRDSASRLYSPRVTLANPEIIMVRNPI